MTFSPEHISKYISVQFVVSKPLEAVWWPILWTIQNFLNISPLKYGVLSSVLLAIPQSSVMQKQIAYAYVE